MQIKFSLVNLNERLSIKSLPTQVATPEVENKIEDYKKENPGIFSWEIRERLVKEGLCSKESRMNVDGKALV